MLSLRTNDGPSVYHSRPTLTMSIDLQEWADVPSTAIPHFTDNLIHFFPELFKHTCSRGYEGGFVERLRYGTYLAHIIEHVALVLSSLSGIETTFGKTRYAGYPGHYDIVTRFKNEEGMKECLRQSFEIVKALITEKKFDLKDIVVKIKTLASETVLGPSGQALLAAAIKRKIPYRRMPHSLIQLGFGKNTRRIQAAVTNQTGLIATGIAKDKKITKQILEDNFIPVPDGDVVSTLEELKMAMTKISSPYVIKPLNGNHGNGVSLKLESIDEITTAFKLAQSFSPDVLIEEMCFGRDYRILLVNGKLIAAAERRPPCVIGDGKKTLHELIAKINEDPRRGEGHQNVLSRIEIDEVVLQKLHKKNISLNDVIANDEVLILRDNANLSSGGTAKDVTEKVHPDIVTLCERAARVIGLDICGLDLIHSEISLPIDSCTKVIEVNAGPGLRMHLSPCEGEAKPVADKIIEMLYPQDESARIPIVAVTGTNGKTTVVRLLHKIFSADKEKIVGLTTTDGIWIGEKNIFSGDTTGPQSSRLVLSDPTVDMAILEVARGGILRGGLAYDWSDVAVITNIREDHIGQDGIEDLDDLLWIKSLVAERVKEYGTLVLNADDPATLMVRNNPRVQEQKLNFFLFSADEQNEVFKNHIMIGGNGCWLEEGWIRIQYEGLSEKLVRAHDISLTLNGRARFQIENILASMAVAKSLGIPKYQMIESLKSFESTQENLGRLNIYQIRNNYVILDYGHNENALSSMGQILSHFDGYKKTVVLGLPGDRDDRLLEKSALQATDICDVLVLKEDQDLRGRKSGEISDLMIRTIQKNNKSIQIDKILDEQQAVQTVLNRMDENEIIIIFYEKLKTILPILRPYDPQPVAVIPDLAEIRKLNRDSLNKETGYVHSL